MNKNIIVIILFLVVSNYTFGQSDFRNGYIINLQNDTIRGLVEYRENSKNYKSCVFKTNTSEREYHPDEILGFGYENDKQFRSEIIDGIFVEVLVTGIMELYRSPNKFHIKKEGEIHDLESFKEDVVINGKEGTRENNRWKGILSYLLSDCMYNQNKDIAYIQFEEKSLTKLVIRYNICRNSDFEELKNNKEWIKYDLGISLGFSKSGFSFDKDEPHLADSYSSMDPSYGIVIGISSPRLSERMSFQSEVHYINSNYFSFVELTSVHTDYHDVYIELSTLSIPISVKYTLPLTNSELYFQSGVNFDKHISYESQLFSERVSNNVVFTYPERVAFEIEELQLGAWAGLGILKSFEKFKASIALRYFKMTPINSIGTYKANSNKLTLNLILFKK